MADSRLESLLTQLTAVDQQVGLLEAKRGQLLAAIHAEYQRMDEAAENGQVIIHADEFLTDTLFNRLGGFEVNQGDGHTWQIAESQVESAKAELIQIFTAALDEVMSAAN